MTISALRHENENKLYTLEQVNSPSFPHKIVALRTVVWFMTWHCNFSCPYCWETQRIKAKEFSPEPFIASEKWIEAWNRLMPNILDITGGEPFMQPGFIELLTGLNDSIKFSLTTNLSHDISSFVQKISPDRFLSITVSYHPTSNLSTDLLAGKIRLLQNRGFKHITVNFVAYPEQMWIIGECKQMIEKLGVRFHVDPYVPTPYNQYDYSPEERNYLSQFVQQDRMYVVFSDNKKLVACSGGSEHMVVFPSGDVFRCVLDMTDKNAPLGNIFDDGFTLNKKWTFCSKSHNCLGCDRDKVRNVIISE